MLQSPHFSSPVIGGGQPTVVQVNIRYSHIQVDKEAGWNESRLAQRGFHRKTTRG